MTTTKKEGLGTSDGNTTKETSSASTPSTTTVTTISPHTVITTSATTATTSTTTTLHPATAEPNTNTTTNSTLARTQAPDDNNVAITSGVISGFIGVALIVVGVIFLLRWLKRRRTNKASRTEGHDDVTIRPSRTGELAAYSKLDDATKSIHHYGKLNENASANTDELYDNQDTSPAQYNNVIHSSPLAQVKKAMMPPEVKSNGAYEAMDIAQHASAVDGNSDPMYMKMDPTTNEAYNNKSYTSSDSDTLNKPNSHSPGSRLDSGYVNTNGMDKRSPAAFQQADSKSSDSETVSHNETNSSDYINTTTIDDIVANGFGKKENRTSKRNRKK